MVSRLLPLLLGALLAWPGAAGAAIYQDEPVGELQVLREELPEPPYQHEMVLITLRGYYPRAVVRQSIEHPDLTEFGWMQLGRDHWEDVMYEGRAVSQLTRKMALFPNKPGALELGSFLHRVTLVERDGSRVEHLVRSEPQVIEVQPQPADVRWWLPARNIVVTDEWDRPPDALEPGQVAQRTVTLEVHGVGAERLPPAPELVASGALIFTDPEERSHRLTKEGPVATVTWRWTLRPMSSVPVQLEAVQIPWFDSGAREMKTIELAPRWIALAGSLDEATTERSFLQAASAWLLPGALLAGFLAGLALLLPGLRLRAREEMAAALARFRPDPDLRDLRRAARAGRAAALRAAARRLVRREGPERALSPALSGALDRLDRLVYGPGSGSNRSEIRPLAGAFLRHWRSWRNKRTPESV